MQRHHAGLRRHGRGVRRRRNGEIDVARFQELQHLRLLAELRTRILVDDEGALAQFLELGGEEIAGNAVSRGLRLVIGEAVVLRVLRAGTRDKPKQRHRGQCTRVRWRKPLDPGHSHLPLRYRPWWSLTLAMSAEVMLDENRMKHNN